MHSVPCVCFFVPIRGQPQLIVRGLVDQIWRPNAPGWLQDAKHEHNSKTVRRVDGTSRSKKPCRAWAIHDLVVIPLMNYRGFEECFSENVDLNNVTMLQVRHRSPRVYRNEAHTVILVDTVKMMKLLGL